MREHGHGAEVKPFAMFRERRGVFWIFCAGRVRWCLSFGEAFALVEQMGA